MNGTDGPPTPLDDHRSTALLSPESSFFRASSNIDELTRALSGFARASSPEPSKPLLCCCQKEDCESMTAWVEQRSKLEKKLQLSAEVGQALLERHETYVRRHEKQLEEGERKRSQLEEKIRSLEESNNSLVGRLADAVKETNRMEKTITQAEVNLGVAEASNRTLLNELQDTRAAVARLSAQTARSTGWETKIADLLDERHDLIQEMEAERSRARVAEAKASATDTKCHELHSEITMLTHELEAARNYRGEFSEMLVKDARARLEGLQNALGIVSGENPEVNQVLEGLVADNEALKRDNAELQNLLAETREDLRTTREELVEKQAQATYVGSTTMDQTITTSGRSTPVSLKHFTHTRHRSSGVGGAGWTPGTALISRGHRSNDSWATSSSTPLSPFGRNAPSTPLYPLHLGAGYPGRRTSEGKGSRRPHSTDATADRDLLAPGDRSPAALSADGPSRPPSAQSVEHPDDVPPWTPATVDGGSPEKPRARPKTLMLLSRNKGVQTDPLPSQPPTPSYQHLQRPAIPQHYKDSSNGDGYSVSSPFQRSTNSESSSIDFTPDARLNPPNTQAPLPSLIERVSTLHARITQSDVRSLTNRFKRQHIVGGDVGHLSKSSLKSITAEVDALRAQFKAALDAAAVGPEEPGQPEPISLLTRSDLRALLKVVRDVLTELVQLRSIINFVTLDPTSANRLKEHALSDGPDRDEADVLALNGPERGRSKAMKPSSAAIGWIPAPIQRFFSPQIEVSSADSPTPPAKRPSTGSATTSFGPPPTFKAPRAAPKLAPAISATTTTVNVEFGSTGTKRATVAEGTDPLDEAAGKIFPSNSGLSSGTATTGSLGRRASSRLNLRQDSTGTLDPSERSRNLLGIFAGAPQPTSASQESWVVIPGREKVERTSRSGTGLSMAVSVGSAGLAGPGFAAHRRGGIGNDGNAPGFNPHRLSRIVDAVIDDNASIAPSERERTLRGRGLSDSSMHQTFINHNPVKRIITPATVALSAPSTDTMTPSTNESRSYVDQDSVLQSLSRKVQSFTTTSNPFTPATTAATLPPSEPQEAPPLPKPQSREGSIPTPRMSSGSIVSPPTAIPGASARPTRSASRGGLRDPSPGGRVLNFITGSMTHWMPSEATGGTPVGSFREDAQISPRTVVRRDTRSGMEREGA